jgi:hypothetical protein
MPRSGMERSGNGVLVGAAHSFAKPGFANDLHEVSRGSAHQGGAAAKQPDSRPCRAFGASSLGPRSGGGMSEANGG